PVNDILLVSTSRPVTPPAGWATVSSTFFYRVIQPGDQGALSVWIVPGWTTVTLQQFSGIDPFTPQDTAPVTGFGVGASVGLGPVDVHTSGSLLVSAMSVDGLETVLGVPAGMSAVNRSSDNNANLLKHAVATQLMPAATSTGVKTWTHTP